MNFDDMTKDEFINYLNSYDKDTTFIKEILRPATKFCDENDLDWLDGFLSTEPKEFVFFILDVLDDKFDGTFEEFKEGIK